MKKILILSLALILTACFQSTYIAMYFSVGVPGSVLPHTFFSLSSAKTTGNGVLPEQILKKDRRGAEETGLKLPRNFLKRVQRRSNGVQKRSGLVVISDGIRDFASLLKTTLRSVLMNAIKLT